MPLVVPALSLNRLVYNSRFLTPLLAGYSAAFALARRQGKALGPVMGVGFGSQNAGVVTRHHLPSSTETAHGPLVSSPQRAA